MGCRVWVWVGAGGGDACVRAGQLRCERTRAVKAEPPAMQHSIGQRSAACHMDVVLMPCGCKPNT